MVSIYSLFDNKFLDPSSYTKIGDLIIFQFSGEYDIEFYFAENDKVKYLTRVSIKSDSDSLEPEEKLRFLETKYDSNVEVGNSTTFNVTLESVN